MNKKQKELLSNKYTIKEYLKIGISVDCVVFGFDGKDLNILLKFRQWGYKYNILIIYVLSTIFFVF